MRGSMKTIIAGSRNIVRAEVLLAMTLCPFVNEITTVVSGTAKGVDRAGEDWAADNGINVVRFPADWKRYKLGAGKIRNKQMAEFSEALIAVWDGKSSGTKNMIAEAIHLKLKVWVWDASKQEGYYE
jgi:hypothetical protein